MKEKRKHKSVDLSGFGQACDPTKLVKIVHICGEKKKLPGGSQSVRTH